MRLGDKEIRFWIGTDWNGVRTGSDSLPEIPVLELRFRYAQADDTLSELRRYISLLQLVRDQNTKHTKSTSSVTRSQGILDGFRGKIRRLASKY